MLARWGNGSGFPLSGLGKALWVTEPPSVGARVSWVPVGEASRRFASLGGFLACCVMCPAPVPGLNVTLSCRSEIRRGRKAVGRAVLLRAPPSQQAVLVRRLLNVNAALLAKLKLTLLLALKVQIDSLWE